MKIGTKVTIKDGSYMVTVKDGVISHEGNFDSTHIIGWCKDTFTVTCNSGVFPGEDSLVEKYINNHIITNDANGEVWFCSEINIKEVETEFKVGQWVYFMCPSHMKGLDRIFRVEAVKETRDKGRFRLYEGEVQWYEADYCRLATPSEIESHLLKVAEKKGFKYGVRFFSVYSGYECKCDDGFIYDKSDDSLYSGDNCVYMQGQWAEVIQSKKKLPKKIEDFRAFLRDWLDDDQDGFCFSEDNREDWDEGINSFLDQYEE